MNAHALAVAGAMALAGACSSQGATAGPRAEIPGADVPVEQVAAEHGNAVWRVDTDGCGWTGVGSAFAVDSTRLVTNYHVIANDTSPTLLSRDGDVRAGRVIGADQERDVAVIEVDDPITVTLDWAPTRSLQPRERVVVLGYPQPEHAFTVSYGEILRFAPSDQDREAVLSNAPVERGSSGGPAMRGDGSVVGLVTRAVLDDPSAYVAIVYPTDQVLDSVEGAIEHPSDVRSFCGLGPDYVPPAPPDIGITEPPPPPSPDVTAGVGVESAGVSSPILTSTTWTRPVEPESHDRVTTSTAVQCPGGALEVLVTEWTTSRDDDGHEHVVVRGSVVNRTTASLTVESVRVTIKGAETFVVTTVPDPATLGPDGAGAWAVTAMVPGSSESAPPPTAAAEARWDDDAFVYCSEPDGGAG